MTFRRPARWQLVLCAVAVWPLAGWMIYEAQRAVRADWSSMAARTQVSLWLTGEAEVPVGSRWTLAKSALQDSLAVTPEDPALHEAMGDLFSAAGQRDWNVAALRIDHFSKAALHYQQATILRPHGANAWAALAMAHHVAKAPRTAVNETWKVAQRLGPYEGHLQQLLLQVVIANWATASPEMRDWSTSLFDKSDAMGKTRINEMALSYGLKFSSN